MSHYSLEFFVALAKIQLILSPDDDLMIISVFYRTRVKLQQLLGAREFFDLIPLVIIFLINYDQFLALRKQILEAEKLVFE